MQQEARSHAAWREIISRSFVPLETEAQSGGGGGFHGRIRTSIVDGIGLASLAADPHTVRRTERLTRAGGGGLFKLSVQLTGHGVLEQDGREVELEPGRLALYDTSKPYTLSFSEDFSSHVLMFPHAALGVAPEQAGQVTATALGEDHPLHGMVGTFIRQAAEALPALETGVGARLAHHVVDVVGTLVADLLGQAREEVEVPAGTTGDLQREAVRAYVEDHLADPDLGPASIAAAHFMSVRSLHLLFEGTGQTVAALVRARRLERCRAELAASSLSGRPVAVIGARWGFADPAHFSRAFRARYGMTPGQFRRQAA